jgi:2-oxoisovalerate dehydrogenase E2 component (dihydrolipoyl transacylase)
MAPRVVKLPDVGEGVAEAEIVEWHVEVGQEVAEDQVLAAVMTDKATVEIPSPIAGRILERGPDVGTKIAVGSKLVAIEPSGATGRTGRETMEIPTSSTNKESPAAPQPERTAPVGRDVMEQPAPAAPAPEGAPAPVRERKAEAVAKPLASPSVRRRALELGIDLRLVPPGQDDGRIRHEDLDAYISGARTTKARPALDHRRTEEIKITGLRRRIAERMAQSTRRIAHFSYVEEVDMTAVEALREHLNARHGADRGKLTVLPFILRAIAVAVEEFPQMNATHDDENEVVTRHGAVHAGIATQTPAGLMVPVVRNAENLDLWESAAEIRRLATAARDASAKRDELSGSTITITSLGELGGLATTPVINWPEVAIIGINRMAVRPVWQDNQFVPHKMMNLSSSFDHRVIDGYDAARFIRRIKELLELPAALFIKD